MCLFISCPLFQVISTYLPHIGLANDKTKQIALAIRFDLGIAYLLLVANVWIPDIEHDLQYSAICYAGWNAVKTLWVSISCVTY